MKDTENFCPLDKKDWRKWLELNHNKKKGVWLIFYKKKSPNYNLSWSESVDEALCFGWIDSTKRSIDDTKYKQYFTKRKAKSNWSKVNKDKVTSLIDKGIMKEEGYKSIEIAKENGSWSILDEVEALVIPEDLKAELVNYKGSMEYFDSLSKSDKKILLYWIVSAKREKTRQNRILEIVGNASKNLKPKQFR
ncbi:MAG: YdeI/OmpD-associated family protein [Balneolaceae bacterium]|nr:YdeI/OmpD-associated family protein [Balneolaceae bacterium]MBO6547250.1 YdeI/OmpD-associated family protein [Balneolaceae bacterium]MBO6647803.1 YdeI/OmpD-associated family protein [Balneolaceae bacterium]